MVCLTVRSELRDHYTRLSLLNVHNHLHDPPSPNFHHALTYPSAASDNPATDPTQLVHPDRGTRNLGVHVLPVKLWRVWFRTRSVGRGRSFHAFSEWP